MKTTYSSVSFIALAAIIAAGATLTQPSAAQQTTQKSAARQDAAQRRTTRYGQNESAKQAKHMEGLFKASELTGMKVRGEAGDKNIGKIDDLMIHRDGKVEYAAVSFGGFLGIGDKLFAVPFDAIEFVVTDNEKYARIDVNEETLKQREGFDKNNWPEMADKSFSHQGGERRVERPTSQGVQR